MKKIPVFLIQGFLEAGKTQFILATIRRDEFYKRGNTLLLVTEEGENEYDDEELKKYLVHKEIINEENFSSHHLNYLYKKYKPARVVIEMNSMFNEDNISLPDYFEFSQIITLVDGKTFPNYYQNMRQKFVNMFKITDVIAFTKLNDRESLSPFQTSIKMINNQCFCCLINEQCLSTQEAFVTPLPYNKKDQEIVIEDNDFGIFYIDTFDNRNDYQDKIVTFNAWVVISDKLKENEFIAGRKVMTCCDNDIQLYGFLVTSSLDKKLKHDSWVRLKAKCSIEYSEEYDEEEVILTPIEIEVIEEIKNPLLDLR